MDVMTEAADRVTLPGEAVELAAELIRELTEAAAVAEPVERARILHQRALPLLERMNQLTYRARAEAAHEANEDGVTFAGIARVLDLSRAMAQKMVEDGRAVRADGVWPPARASRSTDG